MSEHAYSLLVDLDELSKRNAAELPANQEVQQTWSGIGFRMGANHFVAPIDEVSEVIDVPSFTIVPGVKSWVRGIANVRGRLLPIMDLSSFLDASGKDREMNRRIIVVDKEDMYSGLVVDEVLGMQHFPTDIYQESVEACGEAVDPFVMGGFQREDVLWRRFKLFELADDPEFLQATVS